MDSLVAVFGAYAAKAAPAPMHIPTLDGNFIYPTRVLIWNIIWRIIVLFSKASTTD
jgi:hypothetical protein